MRWLKMQCRCATTGCEVARLFGYLAVTMLVSPHRSGIWMEGVNDGIAVQIVVLVVVIAVQ